MFLAPLSTYCTREGIKKLEGEVAGLQQKEKDLRSKSEEIEASSEAQAAAGRKAVAQQMENHRDAEMVRAARRLSKVSMPLLITLGIFIVDRNHGGEELEKEKLRKVFETEVCVPIN